MRKRIALLCVCSLACVMLFAACGNKNKENMNQSENRDNVQTETILPDNIVENEPEDIVTEQPETELPAPEATLSLVSVSSTEGMEFTNSITIDEDGTICLLTSSMELAGVGIYTTDLTAGMEYDASAPPGYCRDVAANEYVSITIAIPEGAIPSLMLVAEEYSGALGKYLLCLDGSGSAYLVPVL